MTAGIKSHYKERYGDWAGNPKGHPPDYARCSVEVWPTGRGVIPSQCSKKNGHGPDGAYCSIHDPEAKARRAKISEERYLEVLRRRCIGSMVNAVIALQQIERGHNDPRALAKDVLDEYRASSWWKEPK